MLYDVLNIIVLSVITKKIWLLESGLRLNVNPFRKKNCLFLYFTYFIIHILNCTQNELPSSILVV